jgi:hypothetical protein
MSILASDLRKLVKIVRQYEVIYGGGISSGDAAVREECENLVSLLESELGGRKGAGGAKAKSASSLPSLVDAKKGPRAAPEARRTASRASELAELTAAKAGQAAKSGKTPPAASSAKVGSAKAGSAKAGAAKAGPVKAGAAKAGSAKAGATKAAAAKATQAKGKAAPASKGGKALPKAKGESPKKAPAGTAVAKSGPRAMIEVAEDLRSLHVGAAKAAAERADKLAGKIGSYDSVESKKRFAALHLFDAFQQNRLPKYGGFIVCVRFSEDGGYTVIEIIGYGNMQDLYPDGDTLVFKSVGCKLYAIVESPSYLLKSVEPVNRPSAQMVPYRFSELLKLTTKRFQNIFVGRKPVFMPTSFSVFKPEGEDLAVLFYDIADVYSNIQDFLIMIMRDRLQVPVADSRKAAETIARGIREFRLWIDEA